MDYSCPDANASSLVTSTAAVAKDTMDYTVLIIVAVVLVVLCLLAYPCRRMYLMYKLK